jgi:hypothetical protein
VPSTRRPRGHERHRLAVGIQGATTVTAGPEVATEPLEGERPAHVVIGARERGLGQGRGALMGTRQVGNPRCPLEELGVRQVGTLVVGDVLPEEDGVLEVLLGLGEAARGLRRLGGDDGGAQRRGRVAGEEPVAGHVRGGRRRRAWALVEDLAVAGVEGDALAGEELLVHRFVQERVAERVAVPVDHQDLTIGGLAETSGEPIVVDARRVGDRGEQAVRHPPAADRRDGDDASTVVGERGHPAEQQLVQGRGQPERWSGARERGELLGEERVALRARPHGADEGWVGRCADDVGELDRDLGAGERGQLDRRHIAPPPEVRDEVAEPVPGRELVAAERQHE